MLVGGGNMKLSIKYNALLLCLLSCSMMRLSAMMAALTRQEPIGITQESSMRGKMRALQQRRSAKLATSLRKPAVKAQCSSVVLDPLLDGFATEFDDLAVSLTGKIIMFSQALRSPEAPLDPKDPAITAACNEMQKDMIKVLDACTANHLHKNFVINIMKLLFREKRVADERAKKAVAARTQLKAEEYAQQYPGEEALLAEKLSILLKLLEFRGSTSS